MAQIIYRGNLSAKAFPFVSKYFGRSIIVPQQDQNFNRQVTSAEDVDKDKGIPQLYYCHNVMPTSEGFQSIGYSNIVPGEIAHPFKDIFQLQNPEGVQVFFAPSVDGTNWVLPFGATNWVQTTTIAGAINSTVTIGAIAGQTFIFYSNLGCYLYDVATNSLIHIELLGLDVTQIKGIVSSFGYLIAWTLTSIAWSSTVSHDVPTDPIDFVPSLITGAGGGSIELAKGKLTVLVPHYLGVIIYTSENAVAALYSGNARYPFIFKPIVSAGGLADYDLVSIDATAGNHYAYTTSGLQLVGVTAAQTIYPEITDFLAGRYFEDFNDVTTEFEYSNLVSPMKKSISVISDRYLVISYGISSLTHAIVYDLVQKRFGKLKVPHVKCFEWKLLTPELAETPRASIGFLQSDGQILLVNFSFGSTSRNGTMILGKYQYVRSRLITLEEIILEDIKIGDTFILTCLSSLDGKNVSTKTVPVNSKTSQDVKKYNLRQTAINHSLLMQGNFYMVSIELVFHIAGRR